MLASLNHPNIAVIYVFEDGPAEADPYVQGVRAGFSRLTGALLLELVDGPTLAGRIAQGPRALDEALPIARQIADALEAGHRAPRSEAGEHQSPAGRAGPIRFRCASGLY